jgi:tetratricopeptide (TPR) repeat protein
MKKFKKTKIFNFKKEHPMKKLTFTLVLCLIAGISFGQKKAVNDAKSEIKVKSTTNSTTNLDEARTLIQGALKNPETMNEAETWYVAGQIEEKQFESEQTKEVMGLKPNEDLMYKSLSKIAPYFIKADELDQLPDAKGKVKPKYRKDMKAIIAANRPYYVNAGSHFYEKEDYQQAYDNFKFYGDIPKLPMFADDASKLFKALADDTTDIKIRYYAGLAASLIPNPDAAIEIFDEIKDLGFNDNEMYQRIAVAYTQQHDTVNFIKILEQGVAKFPKDPYYTLNLINLNINRGETDKAIDYLQKALALSPNDAQLYDVLGLVYENTKETDKAIESIKKAIEIDPDNADALSHLGRLYYNTGIEARGAADNITDKKLYDEAMKKVEDYFTQAVPYFEKAYELNSDDSDAVFALRNIYYSLGNNDAYEKWDKIYSGK